MKENMFRSLSLLALVVVLSCGVFSYAEAAEIYLDPDIGTYGPGDTFMVNVRIDSKGECINAAHVMLTYPTETLRAVDFGKGGSILTLWIEEPKLDTEIGTVSFSGGIPGGYCGRIPGDPVISNILGKVVFTVINADKKSALIGPASDSQVYLNDGLGTEADLTSRNAAITIVPESIGATNPWLSEVDADKIPPDSFAVEVQSTRGVFGGKYYIVFATVDKQSGVDHFEILENEVWKTIESPYILKDQTPESIQVRAIDKAGNERLGEYSVDQPLPPKQTTFGDLMTWVLAAGAIIVLIVLGTGLKLYRDRSKRPPEDRPVPPETSSMI